MEDKEGQKNTLVTQISVAGFGSNITAEDLKKFFEDEIGLVWRCRLKTSWTPPESYPDFEVSNLASIRGAVDYRRVEPHAFIHFAAPQSVIRAEEAAKQGDLSFNGQILRVSLGPLNPHHLNQRRRTIPPFKLPNVKLQIGTLVSRDDFYIACSLSVDNFLVDPFDNTCKFCLSRETAFSIKDTVDHVVIKCDFKLEFLVRDVTVIKQYKDSSHLVVLLQLSSSPRVWYRTAEDDIVEPVPFDLLDDDDPWIRTTDFTPTGAIGRCNSYRVLISPRHGLKLKKAVHYLRERRVVVEDYPRWPLRLKEEPDDGTHMSDAFFCIHHVEGISFELLFMVNAVMHKGIFNQHQLSDNFFDLLRDLPMEVNLAALKHICSYKHPVFDAHKRLKVVQEWLLKNPKLYKIPKQLDDLVEIRRLVITPTRAYCLPPEVEISNRVLRNYKAVSDRFLRVTFMDEGLQSLNFNVLSYYVIALVRDKASNPSQKTRVFKRVKSILTDGFYLCGRKYSFLAFSANQLRDRSAWFFAENKNITVHDIKAWMGKFTHKVIAKCAARMGQCFSSTYATVNVPQVDVDLNLSDIERNNYTFSDGIGKITPDLAMEVAEKLKLDISPCAYQIRYAGYKGVVACWPAEPDGFRLSLRPSMHKFISKHTMLEICSWTRFQPGFLNRQIITLLSALNVPDEVFWRMQDSMVSKLNKILFDADVAFEILSASCAEQGNTAAIMLSSGFKPQTEPHLQGMLTCIRAGQLWGLREKSRIFVSSGRWLMGCFDELGVLEHGQCFVQVSNPSLENCFSKHGSRFSKKKLEMEVIKGFVVVAKNPCLHPGDIRILEAVDAPDLYHLYDCLVFPQNGERPHPNEASGSDLDGDLYFVTWDENLIPPSKKSWPPMPYDAAEAQSLRRPVTHQDIIDFFAKNMVNENLGAICNAHVVHADLSDYGALDEKCIKLAELAATAVDFPKTGKLVIMPVDLKPKQYPDFMGKEEYQSYKSQKILGRLYRQIKDVHDEEMSVSSEVSLAPKDVHYDQELEVPGSVDYLEDAWDKKCSYDGQLNGLMGQYKVKREEELVTGHIWSMPKYASRKQGELKERLKHSYTTLKKEFRQIFDNLGSDLEQLDDDKRNLMYERKASAWYQVTYHPIWVKMAKDLQEPDAEESCVMLSFPWIAADYLARIKVKHRGIRDVDFAKPVNSLQKYLADRL